MSQHPSAHPRTPETVVVSAFDKPAHGGACLTRLSDGCIAFVTGVAMGDKDVTVELDPPSSSSSKRSFRTGRALHIGTPSLHRVVPQCPAAAAGAGCCDLDFLDAEGSLEFKKSVVLDQFERIGKITLAERLVTSHSLEPFQGWRTRARLAVDPEGNVGIRKKNSHEVVPVTATTVCAQWAPALVAGLPEQIEKLRSHGMIRANTELAIAVGTDGQRSVVELSGNRRHRKTKPLVGDGTITQAHGTLTWELPAQAFWQGHSAAVSFYTQWISEKVPSAKGQVTTGWDLYGGAGSLSAALVDKVDRVVSVDIASEATSAGSRAYSDAKIHSVEFWDSDVDRVAERVAASEKKSKRGAPAWWRERDADERLHAVVLDPPRTGAGKHTIRAVAGRRPRHVVHVGCDPAAAARDVRRWIDAGYAISAVAIVDAFGLTHHVEVLIHLEPATQL